MTVDSLPRGITAYPRQGMAEHLRALDWEQGDHLLIAAPTKAGKTTLMSLLSHKRRDVVVMVSKVADPTFRAEFRGWERYDEWPKNGPHRSHRKILLWPRAGKTMAETRMHQREVFSTFLDRELRRGGRCIVVDEGLYMSDAKILNMSNQLAMCFYWGRSAGTSMVMLTQRPSWIPKTVYGNITHAYVARTRDIEDARRLAALGGVDWREVSANLARLPARHDYVYLNPQGDAPPVIVNSRR